ncbi:MAG: hypothetical protein UHM16_00835 [Acutalibacteraceae bacterium]|nr:hypothetical protein [Acutalibacteraceae bacterium]
MKEIGGYIELDRYHLPLLHEDAIALNCGRNALAYLIEAKKIQKIVMPRYMCDSCNGVLQKYNVAVRYYSINMNFLPKNISLDDGEWLYLINYYGQLTNEIILNFVKKYKRVIVDCAQAYFQMPVLGVDTLYTCRKFFGVSDGAFLYTDKIINRDLEYDESFERIRFLTGRFERTAGEFYNEYAENNLLFKNQPIKKMSKLTNNLLRGIDYESVKVQRTNNFAFLHENLYLINKLSLTVPEGAFMYPLYIENGASLRKKLQEKKIYIPTLWPDVFEICKKDDLEYDMAENILPLPVDQRYSRKDMEYIISEVQNA